MQSELLKLLKTFVAFRTIAGREDEKRACLDWILETFLPNNDTRLTIQRGIVDGAPWLYLENSDAKLLWFAHIDVISAHEEQFALRREHDRIIGRGTKDMKGAALPFLIAYREMTKEGNPPPVSILLSSDEETAGPTIPTLLNNGIVQAPVAFTPDSGNSHTIVTEHKGVVWATLTVKGKGCHGALPWEGQNPIMLLADALKKLSESFPPGSEDGWELTVSPTKLQGSAAHNVVPDEAICSLDIRYPPEDFPSADEVMRRVKRELPSGCSLETVLTAPPLMTDPRHPMVQRVKAAAEKVLGEPVDIGREHGATDARYFPEAGIPAFLFGPIGGGIHGNDEWVSLKSLLQHYEISKRLLKELAS